MKLSAQSHIAREWQTPGRRSSLTSPDSARHVGLAVGALDGESETGVPPLGHGAFLSLRSLLKRVCRIKSALPPLHGCCRKQEASEGACDAAEKAPRYTPHV